MQARLPSELSSEAQNARRFNQPCDTTRNPSHFCQLAEDSSPLRPDATSKEFSLIRAQGYRVTRQRIEILRVLTDAAEPVTIELLHGRLGVACDLVTVYRSLDTLCRVGLVRGYYAYNGTRLYARAGNRFRYAFVSRNDGYIKLLEPSLGDALRNVLDQVIQNLEANGYRGVTPLVQFFGDPPVVEYAATAK